MRLPIAALAVLFLAATLPGCGGSATIPAPPSNVAAGPPPGSSPEMARAPKNAGGTMPGAMQGATPPPKTLKNR
jgi:hypothetical protein